MSHFVPFSEHATLFPQNQLELVVQLTSIYSGQAHSGITMKFKLRKGMSIGALSAENDELLTPAFVDLGHLNALKDPTDPKYFVLGRAGSGKTALLKMLSGEAEKVSWLDPDDLSMQYLHNSPVLRTIASWGVNLDIFYKYLWRHVCILELIRMRYSDVDDVPSKLQQIFEFDIAQLWRKDEKKTREISQEYLEKYGNDYWIRTDTRIKGITTEIESRLKEDPTISGRLGAGPVSLTASFGREWQEGFTQRVEQEVVERAQSIVSDFQVAALNRVVDMLSKHGFNDPQKKYYILIDDLDKNWMPDDALYLDLIKSLLYSVGELNRKLNNVKIIVALRENIYHRVFQKSARHEPQREKWLDVQIRLKWSREDLTSLVNNRLREVFRKEYTLAAPTLGDVLPERKRRTQEDATDFIFDRTFMRPRDLIDFINTCIDQADSFSTLSWSNLTRAEADFSQRRMQSVFDEWKDSYYGLPALFSTLKHLGVRFSLSDFTDDDVFEVIQDPRTELCEWLKSLSNKLLENHISTKDCKISMLQALYLVGIVGIKEQDSSHVTYSFDRAFNYMPGALHKAEFVIHKMFWHALNVTEGRALGQGQ